jgi:hypothetical protein
LPAPASSSFWDVLDVALTSAFGLSSDAAIGEVVSFCVALGSVAVDASACSLDSLFRSDAGEAPSSALATPAPKISAAAAEPNNTPT